MLVKTLREHANRYGQKRCKKVGDSYEHPDPTTLIGTGFVVDAAAGEEQEAAPAKPAKGAKQPNA